MNVVQSEPRSLSALCTLLGYTRQAYYHTAKTLQKQSFQEDLLIKEVLHHRKTQRNIGTRKLLPLIDVFMRDHNMLIGREALFNVLRDNGLLIRKRKRIKPKTTDSSGWFHQYPNLIAGMIPDGPNQIWVSDITFISVKNDNAFLSLITDLYSRKIVGYYLCRNLTAYGTIQALRMAMRNNPSHDNLIHHSDRGSQYRCEQYRQILGNIRISMTEKGDPRENAVAERVNGILKTELLEEKYDSFEEARTAVEVAIGIYNTQRPHSSIDMLFPEKAHQMNGLIKQRWKNYYLLNKRRPNM